jgi:hypothetical protein
MTTEESIAGTSTAAFSATVEPEEPHVKSGEELAAEYLAANPGSVSYKVERIEKTDNFVEVQVHFSIPRNGEMLLTNDVIRLHAQPGRPEITAPMIRQAIRDRFVRYLKPRYIDQPTELAEDVAEMVGEFGAIDAANVGVEVIGQ